MDQNLHLGDIDLTGIDPEEVVDRLMNDMSFEQATKVIRMAQEQTSKQMQAAAQASTREGLIENFFKAREEMQKLYRQQGTNNSGDSQTIMFNITSTQSHNVKPANTQIPLLKDCLPLTISSMSLNTTHQHRHLCGKVAVADSFRQIQHMYFLLEDIHGTLVRVSVYNTHRTFHQHETLTILAPYYKVAADMIPAVRVDNPKEIVAWDAPTTAMQWKELGDRFGLADDFDESLFCYEKGMNVFNQDIRNVRSEVSTLLTNIALCDSNLQRYQSSVWFAGVGVFLDETNHKAWYRLMASLSKIDLVASAEVARACPTSPELQGLMKKLQKPSKVPASSASQMKGLAAWSHFHPSWSMAPDLTSSASRSEFDTHDWSTIRDQARTMFGKKDYESARRLYVSELQSKCKALKEVATLALDMSGALHKVGRTPEAMVACTVSMLLDRTNAKSWIRRADIMETLDGHEAALQFLENLRMEISASPSNLNASIVKRCDKRIKELKLKQAHKPHVKVVGDRSTEEQLRDRRTREYGEKEKDYDQYIANMEILVPNAKRMISSLPIKYPLMRLLRTLSQRKVPSVDTEFPKHLDWPAGFDKKRGAKMLRNGYLDASNNPWNMAFIMAEGMFPVEEQMLLKRWNGPPRAQEFLRRQNTLAIGEIVDVGPNFQMMYDPAVRSVFVNTPPNPLTEFRYGTVHVSIGFNDLGELLSSKYLDDDDDAQVDADTNKDTTNLKGPLQFVGIEKSEYAVARSLVMTELLLDKKVPIPIVFQIWYSAGWTNGALKSFRSASQRALIVASDSSKRNENVASYLNCWLSDEPISAADSRIQFFNMDEHRPSKLISDSCTFHRLVDRVAILHYMMTGELIPVVTEVASFTSKPSSHKNKTKSRSSPRKKKETPSTKISRAPADCGSLLFWNTPPNSAPLESDVFFNTISLETLLEEYHRDDDAKTQDQHTNMVDVLIRIKLDQLHRLRTRLIRGRITIDLRCDVMDEHNGALIQELARLRPASVSWSNLVDYQHLRVFHHVARRLNSPRHYGYSMNWITVVYGASMIDYLRMQDTSRIRSILTRALMTPPTTTSQQQKQQDHHPLLTYPFFDTPLNLAGYVLAKEQCENWIRHFEESSATTTGGRELRDCSKRAKVVSHCMLEEYPLYRLSTTQYMEWTYDPSSSGGHRSEAGRG